MSPLSTRRVAGRHRGEDGPRRTAGGRLLAPALGGVLASALLVLSGCAGLPDVGGADVPYPTISPRPGMKAVSRSHFGFGVPREWRQGAGRDRTYWHDGRGTRRLYAEVLTGCGDKRKPEDPPPKLASYGSDSPLRVSRTSRFSVPGAAAGWRYELTGAGGERRTALNTWIAGCDKEIWLVISAPKRVADEIADSVVAKSKP